MTGQVKTGSKGQTAFRIQHLVQSPQGGHPPLTNEGVVVRVSNTEETQLLEF